MGERERFIERADRIIKDHTGDPYSNVVAEKIARIAAEEKAELVEALGQAVEAIQAFNGIRIDAPGYAKRHRDAIMRYVPEAAGWEALLAKHKETQP